MHNAYTYVNYLYAVCMHPLGLAMARICCLQGLIFELTYMQQPSHPTPAVQTLQSPATQKSLDDLHNKAPLRLQLHDLPLGSLCPSPPLRE